MSIGKSRRVAMQAMLAALAVPLLPARSLATEGSAIAPPLGKLLYTRRLIRELPDGAAIVATRGFSINFLREEHGFRIEGHQILSEVDAPAGLEAISRIERNRVEDNLFPIHLDLRGMIVADFDNAGRTAPTPRLAASVRLENIVQDSAMESGAKQDAAIFIRTLGEAAHRITSHLPARLFIPPQEKLREEQAVVLPNGDRGLVIAEFGGRLNPVSGLMAEAHRLVETRIDGTVRRTREEWGLSIL